jgi:CO/xanthine dehydrogenase FAD-binding subunit
LRFHDRIPAAAPCAVSSPTDSDTALSMIGPGSMVVGGATDVQVMRRLGLIQPGRLVCIADIAEMRKVDIQADGAVTVGAAVTLAELADALREHLPAIADTISRIASPQIRNTATVAGNLLQSKRCWFFRSDFPCFKRVGPTGPCYAITGDHRFYHSVIEGHRCQAVTPSDLATSFIAVDAVAVIKGPRGERRIPLSELYVGPGETVVTARELLMAIEIPGTASSRRATFDKLTLWEGDFAVAAVALSAVVDSDGRWRDPRVVLGGVSPTPRRLNATERALDGRVVSVTDIRELLDLELNQIAHPLPRNAWKLDVLVGLAEIGVERMQGAVRG